FPIEQKLPVTLEEVLTGTIKKVEITRSVTDDDYNETRETVELLVEIRAGIVAGSTIWFNEDGHRHPETTPGDVMFVVQDAPHPIVKRENQINLLYNASISHDQSIAPDFYLEIPTL